MPGCDPRVGYGDLWARGVRGLILEAFGVGNMPDTPKHGWLPWLRQQRHKGMQVGGQTSVICVAEVFQVVGLRRFGTI